MEAMIGLSTYAFFWELRAGMSLVDAFAATREYGVELFQICDHAPLETMSDTEVQDAAAAARELGVTIQLGTKGVEPDRMARFLDLARTFGATLVRSMTVDLDDAPLRGILPAFEEAGVTLALETYEQIATADLVALVERIDSPALGICLDPANVVARLESPRECVESVAPYVRNVHVKDFAFARQDGWVGFTYGGAPMGTGLHDYPHLLRAVRPRERGIDEIVEHWLSWQGDAATTIRTEREWTRTTLDYLRSTL